MAGLEYDCDAMLARLNMLTWPEVRLRGVKHYIRGQSIDSHLALAASHCPQILRRCCLYGPLGAELRALLTPEAMRAVVLLGRMDYYAIPMRLRLALLKALVDAVSASVRRPVRAPRCHRITNGTLPLFPHAARIWQPHR